MDDLRATMEAMFGWAEQPQERIFSHFYDAGEKSLYADLDMPSGWVEVDLGDEAGTIVVVLDEATEVPSEMATKRRFKVESIGIDGITCTEIVLPCLSA